MDWNSIIRMAWDSVRTNWLRSALTISIIAIGIMALVGILTALDGITHSLGDSLSGLGANSFEIIRKVERSHHHRPRSVAPVISYKQAMGFKERFRAPAKVSVSVKGSFSAVVKYGRKTTSPNIAVIGIDENYLAVHGLKLLMGRSFSAQEVAHGAHATIIGHDLVKELFHGRPELALGSHITANNIRLKVIGIQEEQGAGMNNSGDRSIYIPLFVAKQLYGSNPKLNYEIVVRARNTDDLPGLTAEAAALFRQLRRLRITDKDDFEIQKSDSIIAILKENTVTLRAATISIGLITLLGAAIGLMNMMLVSVTERTRQIGIQKALGARQADIRRIFLTEALLIGQIGGVIGIILGIAVGNIIPIKMGGHFVMPWGWLALGIAMCLLVGVLSGYYPAKRAAELDPIEALRHE